MTSAHEPSAREADLSAPSPAAPAGREDEGQRYFEDKSASELSDKYPAGLHPFGTIKRHSRTSNETSPERRRVSLDVRLTVADREAIRNRAHALGVKPSAWGRAVMLDALDARRGQEARMHEAALATPQPERARAIEQLRRVGVNLNQSLRTGRAVDAILLREVLAALEEIRFSFGDRTKQ
jgi:hypothetical protein